MVPQATCDALSLFWTADSSYFTRTRALGAYVCSFLHHLIPLKRKSHHSTLLIRLLVQSSIVILHSFRARGAHAHIFLVYWIRWNCIWADELRCKYSRAAQLIVSNKKKKIELKSVAFGFYGIEWSGFSSFLFMWWPINNFRIVSRSIGAQTSMHAVYRIQRRWTTGRFSIRIFINGNFNSLTSLNVFHYIIWNRLNWNGIKI